MLHWQKKVNGTSEQRVNQLIFDDSLLQEEAFLACKCKMGFARKMSCVQKLDSRSKRTSATKRAEARWPLHYSKSRNQELLFGLLAYNQNIFSKALKCTMD